MVVGIGGCEYRWVGVGTGGFVSGYGYRWEVVGIGDR